MTSYDDIDDGPDPDLLEERDFLLRSLRDLEREHEAGDLSDADYAELRDQYTARAAAVLRAVEEGGTQGDADRYARAAGPGRWMRWLAVLLVVALLAGYGVASFAGERGSGEAATGSIEGGPADELARASRLLGQGDALGAVKLYDAVLREDPSNVEALAYKGWVLHLAGLSDQALVSIDRALAVSPTYPDARFFRGFIRLRVKGDPAGAAEDFRAFLANDPPAERVPAVEGLLQEALTAAEASTATTAPPP